jgi:hypothetical protein
MALCRPLPRVLPSILPNLILQQRVLNLPLRVLTTRLHAIFAFIANLHRITQTRKGRIKSFRVMLYCNSNISSAKNLVGKQRSCFQPNLQIFTKRKPPDDLLGVVRNFTAVSIKLRINAINYNLQKCLLNSVTCLHNGQFEVAPLSSFLLFFIHNRRHVA